MVEWVASMALGVLTHADWGVPRLLRSCPGPVYTVPLAYDVTEAPQADPTDRDGRFTVVTAGQINLNKRPESIIQAIGGDAHLRDRLHYRLVGGIEPGVATRLTELANGLGVRLTILGEVSDETFSQELAGADLICCLRYPALESASATAIEAMLSGKAVLVTDVGSYRDLPDDCVRKIAQDDELAQLRDALTFFHAHPHERALLGQRARTFAQTTFSASRYAERLVELAEAVTRTAPLDAAMRFYAQVLAGWGAGEALPTQDILGPLAIFGPSPGSPAARAADGSPG
jgi:glycosyltransferase involved in cell wall biosynthesis